MSDEKFISIPYSIWNTKYKPMEQALEYSRKELEREKESKIHKLEIDFKKFYLELSPYSHREYDTKRIVLGTFIVDIDKWSWNKKPSPSDMYSIIRALIEETNYYRGNQQLTMPSVEELAAAVEKINKNTRFYAAISEKINKLPRIVRWLFKIKKPQL